MAKQKKTQKKAKLSKDTGVAAAEPTVESPPQPTEQTSPAAIQDQAGTAAPPDTHEADDEQPQPDTPPDFESWYLRHATAEYADDIEKLRKAKDFTEDSVPILVEALRAGAAMFTDEQKARIMEAVRKDRVAERAAAESS